ncbi:MAG: hypothetical protein AB7G23_20445 [Vicinamibacterales bacterium]
MFAGTAAAVVLSQSGLRGLPALVAGLLRRHRVMVLALFLVGVVAAAWSVPTWPEDPSANTTPLPDTTADTVLFLRRQLWQQWNAMIGVPNDWIVSPVAHLLLTVLIFSLVGLAALVASCHLAVVLGGLVVAVLFVGLPATVAAGFSW